MILKKISGLSAIAGVIGTVALVTNPGVAGYQQYTDEKIATELKERICSQVAEDLGAWLEGQCHVLIATASPYLAEAIAQQTERQNFYLFSIYQADLALPAPLPRYHVATIGIFGSYYTYQAEQL